MRTCFEHGVNFFDNAEAYGGPGGISERVMGEAIQMGVDEGVWNREELVISTKLFFGTFERNTTNPNVKGLSRKHLTEVGTSVPGGPYAQNWRHCLVSYVHDLSGGCMPQKIIEFN